MEIADPLIITAIGSLGLAVATMGAAVGILFHRSEICLADREKQAKRIDGLELAICGCPVQTCPNKPSWKKPETTTLSFPNQTQTTS